MIQCDVCLTWQHGLCLNINTEQQVPEMYICSTCENPRLGRQSSIYLIPTYWKGKPGLPSISRTSPPGGEGVQLDHLCNLMSELSALSSILHSLNIKLHVAEQKNHPKVFMWSSAWETEEDTSPSSVLNPGGAEDASASSVLPWADSEASFLSPVFGLDLPGDFSQANFAGLPPEVGGQQEVGGHQEVVGDENDVVAGNGDGRKVDSDRRDVGDAKLAAVKRPGSRTRSVTFSDEVPTAAAVRPVGGNSNINSAGTVGQPSKSILREPTPATSALGGESALVNGDQIVSEDGGGQSGSNKTTAADASRGSEDRETAVAAAEGETGNESDVITGSADEHGVKSSGESSAGKGDLGKTTVEGSSGDGGDFDAPATEGCTTTADDFSFFDFPSLTEVKELLPGVLKDISGLELQANPPPPPPPAPASIIIPEPKLINREESRANLVSHLDYMQNLVDEQLDCIETHVMAAEAQTAGSSNVQDGPSSNSNPLDCSRINRGMFKLIKELRSMKKLNSMLLERA